LRHRRFHHAQSGRDFAFGAVLVDPPRAGLDPLTLELVAHYNHVLYVSCNPFVSLRRDLDGLLTHGFALQRLALIDHFPYTPHTECAVYLART
jgi:tRNA (uracil-5-)-methyltransferase